MPQARSPLAIGMNLKDVDRFQAQAAKSRALKIASSPQLHVPQARGMFFSR